VPGAGFLFLKIMERTEIVIAEDGALIERTLRERHLEIEQTVFEELTSEATRIIRNVMTIPEWGVAHANVGLHDTLWSVAIDRIPLRARFRLANKVLVPAFACVSEPEMPLVWRAPAEVRLIFVIRTEFSEGKAIVCGNWLFAWSDDNNGYRLPLPNLHDDCLICTGEFEHCYPTVFEGLAASLAQFGRSKWNSDLMRDSERSQKFFRFRPTAEGFETLPIEAQPWTGLCDKVSTALMERIVP
jgi:hypothetical protein